MKLTGSGIWRQPAMNAALWASAGITTLVGFDNGSATSTPTTLDQWCASAAAAKLNYVLNWTDFNGVASVTAALQARIKSDPLCVGVYLTDEPNGAGTQTPGQCLDAYEAVKLINPNAEVLINLDGWKLQYQPVPLVEAYSDACDLIGFDFFVIERGQVNPWQHFNSVLATVGASSKAGLGFGYVGVSDQGLALQAWASQPDDSGTPPKPRMRCPTAAEVGIQFSAIVKAGGFPIYFAHDFALPWPQAWNGTTPATFAAMQALNATR